MKRILNILTVASAIAFCFFVVIWPVSYEMNLSRSLATGKYEPSDSIPLPAQYHLGFEEGGMWFFSHPTPYRGSIIGMTSANDPPPYRWFWHIGFFGFGHEIHYGHEHRSERTCDFPGIYFRRFWWFDDNPPYTTLRLSLWYQVFLSAILPLLWVLRRRRLGVQKS